MRASPRPIPRPLSGSSGPAGACGPGCAGTPPRSVSSSRYSSTCSAAESRWVARYRPRRRHVHDHVGLRPSPAATVGASGGSGRSVVEPGRVARGPPEPRPPPARATAPAGSRRARARCRCRSLDRGHGLTVVMQVMVPGATSVNPPSRTATASPRSAAGAAVRATAPVRRRARRTRAPRTARGRRRTASTRARPGRRPCPRSSPVRRSTTDHRDARRRRPGLVGGEVGAADLQPSDHLAAPRRPGPGTSARASAPPTVDA